MVSISYVVSLAFLTGGSDGSSDGSSDGMVLDDSQRLQRDLKGNDMVVNACCKRTRIMETVGVVFAGIHLRVRTWCVDFLYGSRGEVENTNISNASEYH